MGNWYTNISVKGARQSDVIAALDELGRRALVTPDVGGWVVVYDQECDKFDLDVLESLALTLSTRLSCTALAAFNADDDILWLGVYENGKLSSRYTSKRDEFEDGKEFPGLQDVADVLCRIFDKLEKRQQVRRILSRPHGILGLLSFFFRIRFAYVTEVFRHGDLSEALGIPRASVGFGYRYVDRGETPDGLDREKIRRTLNG